ncbi:MAG: oligosaccharide flippase family protein [Methanophagales archaeon]|nr:oligosaccharide flippase family protein [Methanophagales archaeon]
MNTVQRIAKNTAALFTAQIIGAILSLVLSIFIARSLGAVIFGKFHFALAFTAILSYLPQGSISLLRVFSLYHLSHSPFSKNPSILLIKS